MRLLDLFCGAGGAAMGYSRAGFTEIVGIDINPQPRYPFKFVQADALRFIESHGHDFDAIHASPPCQGYTPMTNRHKSASERLVPETRVLLEASGRPFILENVPGAPLRIGLRLCGSSFGLKTHRHRNFESNVFLWSAPPCNPDSEDLAVYGPPDGRWLWERTDGSRLLTDWREVREAIPPAFTEFIGRQLLDHLRATEAA